MKVLILKCKTVCPKETLEELRLKVVNDISNDQVSILPANVDFEVVEIDKVEHADSK